MKQAVGIRAAVTVTLVSLLASKALSAGQRTSELRPSQNPQHYLAFSQPLSRQDQFAHALDRLTFGARPGDMARLQKTGLKRWLEQQLNPETMAEDQALEERLRRIVCLGMSIGQASRQFSAPQDRKTVARELSEAKILRAVYSRRQLAEQLDDFWFNHFNVSLSKGRDRYMIPSYEQEAIRPHVLGRFYDLLVATAESPAMLFYLDNWQSVGVERAGYQPPASGKARRGLNENYGRELLELHTLGVDGGYTQKDVIEVARCFTGWTIANPRNGGGFEYNDRVHDKGEKIVLGHVIPANGGMNDGLQVLEILAHHPATAHFISLKLAQRFVADDPPPGLVQRMSKAFLETGGDLREVMRTMLTSPQYWSEGAYRAKVKTPFEMIVSALRATNAEVTSTDALEGEMRKMGEPLYRKIEPNGYSDINSDWVSSAALLERMNFAVVLAENRIPGVAIKPVSDERSGPIQIVSRATGLTLGSPEFQRR